MKDPRTVTISLGTRYIEIEMPNGERIDIRRTDNPHAIRITTDDSLIVRPAAGNVIVVEQQDYTP